MVSTKIISVVTALSRLERLNAKVVEWVETSNVETLINTLTNVEERMRRRVDAANALGKLGDTTAVIPLINTLQDENRNLRAVIVKVLGTLRDVQAIDALLQALQDEDRGVRRAAATSLGKFEDVRVVPALIQALHDNDWEVQKHAATSLAEIGEPALVSLIEMLQDESKYIRRAAVRVLGTIADKKAVEPLEHALNDEDREVQILAKKSLNRIKEKNR